MIANDDSIEPEKRAKCENGLNAQFEGNPTNSSLKMNITSLNEDQNHGNFVDDNQSFIGPRTPSLSSEFAESNLNSVPDITSSADEIPQRHSVVNGADGDNQSRAELSPETEL